MHHPGEWHAAGNNTLIFCLTASSETVQMAALLVRCMARPILAPAT